MFFCFTVFMETKKGKGCTDTWSFFRTPWHNVHLQTWTPDTFVFWSVGSPSGQSHWMCSELCHGAGLLEA